MRFLDDSRHGPFFLLVATNAPHAPYWVEDRYRRPYADLGVEEPRASFYGMIENVDENFGRLRAKLKELDLERDTILVFLTDNGSSAGWRSGHNAAMRAGKGSNYDGGHRVPLFVRWPAGGVGGGRDVGQLSAHIDLLPTLLELTGIQPPAVDFDGASLAPLLTGRGSAPASRPHFVQHQQVQRDGTLQMESPRPFYHSAVLTQRWRLVNGKQLYDIAQDPGQRHDLSGEHPNRVSELRGLYELWWRDVTKRLEEYTEIPIGVESEDPVRLTSFDWYTGGPPNQRVMLEAPTEGPWADGFWAIDVVRSGRYRVTLMELPPEAQHPINGSSADLRIGSRRQSRQVPRGAISIAFELDLDRGKTTMRAGFTTPDGLRRGAYFAYVRWLG